MLYFVIVEVILNIIVYNGIGVGRDLEGFVGVRKENPKPLPSPSYPLLNPS